MEQHTPPQRAAGSRRTAGSGTEGSRPGWLAGRPRLLVGTACAAALAVALAAGFFSTAEARTTMAATGFIAGVPGAGGSASASAGPNASAPATAPAAGIDEALDSKINAVLEANSQYQIGVALMDVSSDAGSANDVHEYGVRDAFVAASTAKVLAAAAYYHLVETGAATLDDPMGAYTSGFQLREMIQQSDNDSWSLIMNAVGHAELTQYAASIGVDYDPETNTLTPAEMATVLAGVYSGTLLNAEDTAQLLSYMQDTNYETLIPAAVPEGITVFHKYGLLGPELHDVGILAQGDRAYALVIYTKGQGLSDDPERTEVIHQITKTVTDALF
jgi:beta-lactamase class A